MTTADARPGRGTRAGARLSLLIGTIAVLAACGGQQALPAAPRLTAPAASPATAARPGPHGTPGAAAGGIAGGLAALPAPAALAPFSLPAPAGQGHWKPAGRRVNGRAAVYVTALVPPGGKQPAGVAWMDTRLLSARLYSGSRSPGRGPYRYTAPVRPAQAAALVAVFNGGFMMKDARGGYYTEHRVVYPLRRGAASLVIGAGGSVTVGAWGSDVSMTPAVVSVRQNLMPLVAGGRPTAAAGSGWRAWGSTCGAASCAADVPGIEHQWRSGLGVTADGGLVYAAGPALDPLQLAWLLARAGVVRGMQLDINPNWPVFATYQPAAARGLGAPSNGRRLIPATVQGPATFFEPSWARDFVTMSARLPRQAEG